MWLLAAVEVSDLLGDRLLCELCEKQTSSVTEKNQEFMVEVLRQLAELILWGDQHDPQFFECAPLSFVL